MKVTIEHGGKSWVNWSPAALIDAGIPAGLVGDEAKASAIEATAKIMGEVRAKLSHASPEKLAEFRVKEDIAKDASAASEEELVILDREAAARGIDRAGLLGLINSKAHAYRQAALLFGANEAEAVAAISAIPNDAPAIEVQIQTVLEAIQTQAETAFNEALALINGGS